MSGDPFRDAFRARLEAHVAAAGITLPVVDLDNTAEDPDASTGYVALEFPGAAPERQFTFGAPGANFHREVGQVTVRVCVPLGRLRDESQRAAAELRARFRMDRFATSEGRTIQIESTAPMGGGHEEGGLWGEAIALGYLVFNVG